jgi:hypothetical protein
VGLNPNRASVASMVSLWIGSALIHRYGKRRCTAVERSVEGKLWASWARSTGVLSGKAGRGEPWCRPPDSMVRSVCAKVVRREAKSGETSGAAACRGAGEHGGAGTRQRGEE